MSLYAQQGYAKTGKIESALSSGYIDGVILSPRDEIPINLENYTKSLAQMSIKKEILFDPQFYATTILPVKKGYLDRYTYYDKLEGLSRSSFSPSKIREYVKKCLDYQMTLPLTRLIAPSIHFDSFQDSWSQIVLSMAQESIDYHAQLIGAPPLLLSLVFSETALVSTEAINEFLDAVSILDTKGFYILVRCNSPLSQAQMSQNSLEKLLYFIYILSEINQFEVIVGYSDIVSILYQAVGANATACGWTNTTRQFTFSRFQPSTGGSQARPRYTSGPLLNSILVLPELAGIHSLGYINQVLTNTPLDNIFRNDPNSIWPADASSLHHWASIKKLTDEILSFASVTERLNAVVEKIGTAKALYSLLTQNMVFEQARSGSSHLDQWLNAIQAFRAGVGV